MESAARVLIVGQSDQDEEDISQAINAYGFESFAGSLSQCLAELSGTRRPDVMILNMNSAEARKNPSAFYSLARRLKSSSLSSRLRVLLVDNDACANSDHPSMTDDIDDVLLGPVKPIQICHRLRALCRLNTMHEELVRRLNTSAKYGVDAPTPVTPPQSIDNVNILFLGDPMGFASVQNALTGQATVVGALTVATALDYLGRQDFDCVVIDSGKDPLPYLDFTETLRRNSQLFNLPVLLFAEADKLRNSSDAYEAGVTDILYSPALDDEIRLRTVSLVREQRFRNSLRHVYKASRHYATNDALTGLYSRGFFLEHLGQVIEDAQKTSQRFSIASFDIQNLGEINAIVGYASADRLIRQIGELISMLVRGEDLAARYSGKKFLVILPDTEPKQAVHAIRRICGVVHHTEFAVLDHHEPINLNLVAGVAGFGDGDTPDDMVERVWSSLVS